MKVGDSVIYVSTYGAQPIRTKVVKITMKGGLRIAESEHLFRSTFRDGAYGAIGTYGGVMLYDDTEKVWNDAMADFQKSQQAKQEKADEQQRQRDECNQEPARQLVEVQDLLLRNGQTPAPELWDCLSQRTLRDGSRLYQMDLPVHPDYTNRKEGFEVLLVRCKTIDKEHAWEEGKPIEMAYTYVNGRTNSFSSISTSNHASDEEAIWEAIRYCYNLVRVG